MRKPTLLLAAAVALTACGGGGGSGPTTSVQDPPRQPPALPSAPPSAVSNDYRIYGGAAEADARRPPIYRTGDLLRVGVDQGTGPERLPVTTVPGFPDVQVRAGTLRDGAGASDLQSYLSSVDGDLSRRLPGYQVRVIGSSSSTERRRVLAAVQLINAALPESARLNVGAPLPGFSLKDTVNSNGRYFGSGRELASTIHVEFVPEAEFYDSDAAGTSWGEYILLSRGTFPAYTDERKAVILMAHELMHSLGIDGHVAARFDTIIKAGSRVYDTAQGSRQPGSLLYPIDREALRALYGPLLQSSDPNNLGPWASTSQHLFVGNAHGAFGVARRNGYAEPWAYGTAPRTDLASNRALSGSVTWSGALVGFTPAAERVAGDAGITVDLSSMAGSAVFDRMVTILAGGQTPQWGDGDLHYSIAVRGNTFRETGGDDGRLTGVFAGRSHEVAGGTLERTDLTAAFGASR